jgi:hypothetical protein
MAFLPALAPLAELAIPAAGEALSPLLESLLGKEFTDKLGPLAKKGIQKLLHSDAAKKGISKIGNKLFGKSKTARQLLSKGTKLANFALGGNAQKLLKSGLKMGGDFGLLSPDTINTIEKGYGKALSLHDTLSAINGHKEHHDVKEEPVMPNEAEVKESGSKFPDFDDRPEDWQAPVWSEPHDPVLSEADRQIVDNFGRTGEVIKDQHKIFTQIKKRALSNLKKMDIDNVDEYYNSIPVDIQEWSDEQRDLSTLFSN